MAVNTLSPLHGFFVYVRSVIWFLIHLATYIWLSLAFGLSYGC